MRPRCRQYFVLAVLLLLGGCSDTPTSPSRASLTFTFSPNPVPSSGLSTACVGTLAKSWYWSSTIRNTGTATFTVTSFQFSVAVPGQTPIVTTGPPSDFADVFGTTTIAPNVTVQGKQVCIGLTTPPSGIVNHTYTLNGQPGESFTTPTLQLLP